jgi:hypothetical protein
VREEEEGERGVKEEGWRGERVKVEEGKEMWRG